MLGAALLAAGSYFWWSGRPERHLDEAERCLAVGEFESIRPWLALPEATARTRDRALLVRARAALAQGRPAEAVRPLDEVDAGGLWAVDAAFWKGRTLQAVGQYGRAAEWFRSFVDRRPGDADGHRWLAAAAYELGDHKTALAELREVVRSVPKDARAWRTIALLLKEDNEPDEARSAYRTTLRLDPIQPDARLELAEVLTTLGQYDEAERELEVCSGRVPEGDRLDLLARGLRARGDQDGFRTLIERAVVGHPRHVGLLHQRAQAEAAERRTAEAIAWLDRALAVDPHHAASYYQRGLLKKALGDPDGAARDLARSSELNATLAEMSRLNDEAAAKPADAEVRVRIGGLCERLGKAEMAAFWYRADLAIDPNDASARAATAALKPQ